MMLAEKKKYSGRKRSRKKMRQHARHTHKHTRYAAKTFLPLLSYSSHTYTHIALKHKRDRCRPLNSCFIILFFIYLRTISSIQHIIRAFQIAIIHSFAPYEFITFMVRLVCEASGRLRVSAE